MMTQIMKYSRYKKYYADCKTVPGTYDKDYKTIEVIIPDGRMKPSGVRNKKFYGYKFVFTNKDGKYTTTYKAICKENAIKRLIKDFNPTDFELLHIY